MRFLQARWWMLMVCACALSALSACSSGEPERPLEYTNHATASDTTVYRVAIHPLYNPHKLIQAYQPLMDYLNAHLNGAHLEIEASRDYAAFEDKVRESGPAFLLPNPVQTLLAQKTGYRVIAMAGDPRDFKGIFVVRKDSLLKQPQDLKGKVVSYPSPTALAGAIMPQYFLHNQGVDVQHEVTNRYVGSHESAILNTYMGHSAAAATWPPPWRMFQKDYPAEAAQLQVLWETPPLINNSVMVRQDVPQALQRQVQALLLGLKTTADGPHILAAMETGAFFPADNKSYEVVARYLTHFEKTVRPVQLKLN